MTKSSFGKDAWVEMFRGVGLDQEKMGRWHHEFEARWPESHEAFLSWLGISEPERTRIRGAARGESRRA